MSVVQKTFKRRDWRDQSFSVGVALFMVAAIYYALWFFRISFPSAPEIVQLEANIPEESLVTENDLVSIETTDFATTPGTSLAGGAIMAGASAEQGAGLSASRPAMENTQEAVARLEMSAPIRPMAAAPASLGLTESLSGVMGTTVDSGGIEGSVDRITAELLHQLNKGALLVVWLFDATGSLKERNAEIFDRFNRIYGELDGLGKLKEDLLLNAVVSFGQGVDFLSDKPTADINVLKAAVQKVGGDETGEENIFTAVRMAASKYRRFQTHNNRNLIIILITDEIGDDLPAIDECLQVVKRSKIPVYVLGPMAPFGRKSVNMTWVDQPTGERFQVPIDRGPESVLPEYLHLPYWTASPKYDLFPSGFGPYGLSLLAHASGGIYFLFDDGIVPGPKFQRDVLSRYHPEYLSLSQYNKMVGDHPLRRAILDAVQAGQGALGQPRMSFPAEDLNASLSEAQKTASETTNVVERAIAVLQAVAKERAGEPDERWQAHYDLMLGRLLATRLRADEYNWALAQMKVNPLPLKGKNNYWKLSPDRSVKFGQPTKQDSKGKSKRDSKANEKAQEEAKSAIELLDRVVKEHPDTPWAVLAKEEINIPLGYKWEDYFVEPPPPNNTPEAMNNAKRREEAAKRAPSKI
jgi:hypothetical protein